MKKSLNAILIPVDFEEASLAAIKQSFNIARQLQLQLHLLYVSDEGGVLRRFFSADQSKELLVKIEADLKSLGEKTEQASGLKVFTHVVSGQIVQKINDMAEQLAAKYIFIGASNTNQAIIGGNAIRVIRSAQIPVFTIKADQVDQNRCRNILLPLDLTADTRQKVSAAISIARVYDATIQILSAHCSDATNEAVNHLHIQFKQVKNFIEKEGVKCTGEIITCSAEHTSFIQLIHDFVETHKTIDLIVITTQAEINFIDYFIDSEATQLIRQAVVPVMSVVPKKLGVTSSRGF